MDEKNGGLGSTSPARIVAIVVLVLVGVGVAWAISQTM